MKNLFRLFMAIALVALIAVANVSVALADDSEENGTQHSIDVVLPDLSKVGGFTSFISQSVQSEKGGGRFFWQRYAQTNIYITGQANGYHLSSSEGQPEDFILVSGGIKEYGDPTWYDTASDWHENAYIAFCTTAMPNPPGQQTFYAESAHYFHTDGYQDWAPVTGKLLEA